MSAVPNTEAVLALIQAAPLGGLTSAQIEEATGLSVMKVQHALTKLTRTGRVVSERLGMSRRLFPSEAARLESAPLLEQIRAEAKAQKEKAYAEYQKQYQLQHRKRATEYNAARYAARKKAAPPKPPKPAKAPKPIKLLQPKPMNKEKAARIAWAAQEAIRPDGVKVTKCPGFTGESRFAPAPDSHGAGFYAEWKQLRSAA